MDRPDEKAHADAAAGRPKQDSVKRVLLEGVFWRILIIEGILLAWSVCYRWITQGSDGADLFWYTMRIVLLVGIIILFMMVSLKSFLTRKVIASLEAIAAANRRTSDEDPAAREVALPEDAPEEIRQIVESRKQMLDTIFKVSEQRLQLMNFIKDTFGRYLSKKVVEEILASPEGQKIGGESRIVTILMSDLRGFTYLSENSDPESIVVLLNRYLGRMSKVIDAYGGTIDEFIGDAILAVFGVPESRDDDPLRAVACGIAMQNALDDLNAELAHEGHPPLEMGIGINTGQVVVGNIGSELRTKYGIVGKAVNVAARIESNTTGGEVFVGESTYDAVRKAVVAAAPRSAMMKGLKQPLVFYPVKAVNAPYDVKLRPPFEERDGSPLTLPFQCWGIENEKVDTGGMAGRTLSVNGSTIRAVVDRPLRQSADVKIQLDFCTAVHCFKEIYAKVTSLETRGGETVNRLAITAIDPEDRAVLQEWARSAD